MSDVNNQRGDRFRDLTADQLRQAYPQDRIDIEPKYDTAMGIRNPDVVNKTRNTLYECKLGTIKSKSGLRQLAKDELMMKAGYDVAWVVKNGNVPSRAAVDEAMAMEQRNPNFNYLDLSDAQSIERFRTRREDLAQGRAEAAERDRAAATNQPMDQNRINQSARAGIADSNRELRALVDLADRYDRIDTAYIRADADPQQSLRQLHELESARHDGHRIQVVVDDRSQLDPQVGSVLNRREQEQVERTGQRGPEVRKPGTEERMGGDLKKQGDYRIIDASNPADLARFAKDRPHRAWQLEQGMQENFPGRTAPGQPDQLNGQQVGAQQNQQRVNQQLNGQANDQQVGQLQNGQQQNGPQQPGQQQPGRAGAPLLSNVPPGAPAPGQGPGANAPGQSAAAQRAQPPAQAAGRGR